MSKILIDMRESGTTTGRYMDKLAEHLHKLGPQHQIALLAKPHRKEYLRIIAPNFEFVETPYREFSLQEQLQFKKQIEELKPDLVHFPMVQQPVLYRGRVVTTMQDLTTLRFRNPTKNTVVFWAKQQIYKALNKYVAHKSEVLIAISDFARDDIAAYCGVSPDKFTTTLLSADPLADRAVVYEPMVGKKFIMYVGRPLPHKNLGRLIDAFALLQNNHPDLHLVLAGKKDAAYAMHEKKIVEMGIKNVVFTGFIEDTQLRWLYENCQAYIFPSLSEGFGLPALEAMLHGAPVVSSNATSLPQVCGDAAHYFDPLDVQDMATKINDVLSSEKLRADMIARGKKQVKKFSWERMARQTLEVYEKALKG
ncbi:MAG: hypothetical protein QG629_394 [Patescibacteria group bacterium]|nr:hypothetical protein [Patescibacteria group bacterium]